MYFIYGSENYFINKEIRVLKNSLNAETIIFDDESSVEEVIMELSIIPMFYSKRFIVIKNKDLFNKKDYSEHMIKALESLGEKTEVAFVSYSPTVKSTNPLVKWLLEKAIIKKMESISPAKMPSTIVDIIKSKGGSITHKAAILLSQKIPNNLRIVILEIEKLLLENNSVDDKMIERSISKYRKEDAFGLTNAIIKNDVFEILDTYNEKVIAGIEPTLIIGQISSILKLANTINDYKLEGLSLKAISDVLKIHIFRVKKANELLIQTGGEQIKKLIKKLAQLDLNIKSGKIEKNKGMDQFILNLIK